jgi:uncharacterized protein (DUF1697 family)
MEMPARRVILGVSMSVLISMLRGVNVGGHHLIRMDVLKALCESLGMRSVQTYVQSGNVIFATNERDLDQLAVAIEDAIEQRCGFRCAVILRTVGEMRDVIRRNPFATRQGVDPRKLAVIFLAEDPGQEARDKVLAMKIEPEELRMEAREYYIYFPLGMGQSKAPAAIARALKVPGTGRNWNSVTKMLEMAEKLESFH